MIKVSLSLSSALFGTQWYAFQTSNTDFLVLDGTPLANMNGDLAQLPCRNTSLLVCWLDDHKVKVSVQVSLDLIGPVEWHEDGCAHMVGLHVTMGIGSPCICGSGCLVHLLNRETA